jgi:hypothetical protein
MNEQPEANRVASRRTLYLGQQEDQQLVDDDDDEQTANDGRRICRPTGDDDAIHPVDAGDVNYGPTGRPPIRDDKNMPTDDDEDPDDYQMTTRNCSCCHLATVTDY